MVPCLYLILEDVLLLFQRFLKIFGINVKKRAELKTESNQQPLSGHSFRVGAALDLLEQGETLEKIMLRGGWQTDSTAMKYLRNWAH